MILKQKYNVKNINYYNDINCKNCLTYKLCIFFKYKKFITIFKQKKIIHKGEVLFKKKERMYFLYTIQSGTIKTYNFSKQGNEQITRFYFKSDLIGLDSIYNSVYSNFSKALETSTLCKVSISKLNNLFIKIPSLGQKIINLMSKEIKINSYFISLLSRKKAEIKLATFIYDLSKKFKIIGYSHENFFLSMTRSDIGNYLGITVETVSRILSKFKKSNILMINGKNIIINNYLKLINFIN
ncbi:fumarate/nitrate reduction transcriptional regulator Fnr [Enterobacteriaceae endosymbiont of Donacia cincticornis]|uniref:fumarate/nitrate reduction transcriptional regulator Fnr n=1 Tax=Enterobacteriaceae endosymbiont of Donacia cincticornis TaxID=2675773 RepID=UPI00144928B6|nr:fumarate/nitrate reduction transcriptional regulator Fnr [Enterobacteriaceae endosymbiont of Donacia cincticornis]QJC35978.1 fumarate/nitrate reduction transcriptional regulator Fnr [Enterobacteriaceae endosymbiont of Donacia cincticornis]